MSCYNQNVIQLFMGQDQATTHNNKPKLLSHTIQYQIDPRLVQFKNTLPSYFSAIAEKIVQQITNLMNEIPPQPLQQYLTHAIDNYFIRHTFKNSKKIKEEFQIQSESWYDLTTQERFLNILNLFARQYQIQMLIDLQYKRLEAKSVNEGNPAYQSLRNRMEGGQVLTLSEQLITRMLLGYYLKQIKIYANSGQKHIMKFHERTGRQLCLMIVKGYLSLMELYGLFYQFVYIDKHPTEVEKKLAIVNRNYHSQCLKTQYSINVEKKKLDKLQTAARLYLDELYLSSMREAEDPEIKNSDDSLLPIKMFPISRVKDKPRT